MGESVAPVKKSSKRERAASNVSAKSAASKASSSKAAKKSSKTVPPPKKKIVESSDSDSDSSSEEKAPKTKAAPAKKAAVVSDSDSSSSEEDVKVVAKPSKKAAKKESSSDSSSEEKPAPKKKAAKKAASSSDSGSGSEAEAVAEVAEEAPVAKAAPVNVSAEDEGKTELFVRGISMNTYEEGLKTMFSKYGELTKCKHLYQKAVAFIQYNTHEEAAAAQAGPNGAELDSANLDVQFSGDRPGPGGPTSGAAGESNTVFCGNMGFRTEEWAVKEFFKSAGEVTTVRIAYDRETERPKGFCHVEFADPAAAAKAVAELNGYELDGRAVRLDLSAGRAAGGGGRGGGGFGGGRGGRDRGGRGGFGANKNANQGGIVAFAGTKMSF